MKISLKSFVLGFGCAAISLGAVTYANASSNSTIKACANKKTGTMRYIAKGKCKKTETSLSWNQMGPTGLSGSAGTNGTAGSKGDTGAAGAAGAKGDTGSKGDTGAAGASSPTGFKPRSVCGPDGTTLCAIGVQGPGGGTIVFVDSTSNEMLGYDYLEVAPTDASPSVEWSTDALGCGPLQNLSCETNWLRDVLSVLDYVLLGTGPEATRGIIVRHGNSVLFEDYAAGVAYEYSTPTATDWFLPSMWELNEVCKYAAAATDDPPGAGAVCSGGPTRSGFTGGGYWSSSESLVDAADAVSQLFGSGVISYNLKSDNAPRVRPVRAF